MPAVSNFIKENVRGAGLMNLLSIPGYAKEYRETESKLKAIVKITADWFFWTLKILSPLRQFFVGGAVVLGFKAVGDAIANIVRQTGSLEAALRRLQAIQTAQRGLAPFLGGAGAARTRVAELTTMAGRGPFKFEDIAAANKQLEILTRGMYSSAQATQKVGQAAIATGNQIGEVADAVGEFYNNLHEGRPIASSAESLRQLGIISQQTANQLVSMQETGASTGEIFGRLSNEIDLAAASMKDMGDSVETVNAEYQKAADNLREKFGAPWTENDVQNTKNMTAAMQAIAPTVQRVSQSWALLFGSFATVRTEIVKFVATTPALRGGLELAAKSLNALFTIALAVATVALPFMIGKVNALLPVLTAKFLGANVAVRLFGSGLGTVIKGAVGLTAIGLAVGGVVMLTGAIINLVHAHRESIRETERQAAAFAKSNQAIKEQIANAKTLAEQQEAVAAAMNQAVDAYSNMADVQDKLNNVTTDYFSNVLDPLAIPKLVLQMKELDAAQASSIDMMNKATATFREATRQRGAMTGPALQRYTEQLVERRGIAEQRRFEMSQELAPGRRPEILRARAAQLRGRFETGEESARQRAAVEHETAELTTQKQVHEFNYQTIQKQLEVYKKMKEPNQALISLTEKAAQVEKDAADEAEGKMLQRQTQAKKGTAVQIEGEIRRNQLAIEAGAALEAGDKERGQQLFVQAGGAAAVTEQERETLRLSNVKLQIALQTAKSYEDQRNQLLQQSGEMEDQATIMEREQQVARQTADLELARRRAERLGMTQLADSIENQEQFMERFEKYRRIFPEQEARTRALRETAEDIFTRGAQPVGGLTAIASSLQRIGGGGGVYTPGGDPMLAIQKQIATLAVSSNAYLATIAGQEQGVR